MMNRSIHLQTVRNAGRPPASRRRRAATTALAVVAGAAVLAGCGHLVAGAQPASPATANAAAATAANLAAATNSDCVQATPVVASALGVLTPMRQGTVTAAAAGTLATDMAGLENLVRATPSEILRLALANTYDAFTAFRAVMKNPNASAYLDTFDNLAGTLSGFHVTCSVVDPEVANGSSGGAAASVNTSLTRSATAHDAPWSLQVANTGTNAATAGFTDAPSSLSPTQKGSEQIGLWARALAGAPTATLQVRELVGDTLVGTQQVTMRLDSTFSFEYLTYQVRRPGASRLSVTISAAGLPPGGAYLVDNITIVRD
jgi:hypothetical protein